MSKTRPTYMVWRAMADAGLPAPPMPEGWECNCGPVTDIPAHPLNEKEIMGRAVQTARCVDGLAVS